MYDDDYDDYEDENYDNYDNDYNIGGLSEDDDTKGYPGGYTFDDPKMMPEIAAYQRAGTSGRLNLTSIQDGSLADLQNKVMKELSSPEETFQLYVDAISRKLNGDNILDISQQEIDAMIDEMPKVPDIQYKNPTAYILGFITTSGGREINSGKIKMVIDEVLPQLPDSGIEAPDVVRYARMWMKLV